MIKIRNKGLTTQSWGVVDSKLEEHSQTLLIVTDDVSLKPLQWVTECIGPF